MWKYEESKLGEDEYMKDPEKDWKLQNPTVISGTVKQVRLKYLFLFYHLSLLPFKSSADVSSFLFLYMVTFVFLHLFSMLCCSSLTTLQKLLISNLSY